MSTKSHTHERCGTLRKKLFSTRGYVEIHIQRLFFNNKKGIQKLLYWKSKWWAHALVPLLRTIFFGQILAKSYNIGQFWVDSVAMAVADCMPPFERKKRKRHNLCKKCQNLACDGLLESPTLNFPSTKFFSKNSVTNWNRSCMPKIPKFHMWNSQFCRGYTWLYG
jgi:hypothetical protein